MNPYGYNEQWMHSQRDEAWKDDPLGRSDVTLGDRGCVIAATAYLLSRFRGHDITPADWNNWLSETNGIERDGDFRWDWLRMNTADVHPKGGLFYQGRNPLFARYTCQWVQLGPLRHFVVLLRNPKNGKNDICFDPWQLGDHVRSVYDFKRRYEKIYFGVNVTPAT